MALYYRKYDGRKQLFPELKLCLESINIAIIVLLCNNQAEIYLEVYFQQF